MTVAMAAISLLLASAAATSAPAKVDEAQPPRVSVNLAAGSLFKDCADCPGLVVIPGGRFQMGHEGGEPDRYEGPVREVSVGRFAAGRYPVTNGQYARFVAATGHPAGQGCRFWDAERQELRDGAALSWRDPGHGRPIEDNEPVVCVSWLDAQAYTRWLSALTGHSYRLLTEAEWEYVARDRTATAYPWGDDPNGACAHANVADASLVTDTKWPRVTCNDGFAGLAPVGSFPANSFGLHDLIGNSWEWVADCYIVPYPARPTDGSAVQAEGACERRSVRGGSWITTPFRQRASWRGRDPENHLTFIFGFRVARDLP